jgi:hypothetical protein
VGKIKREVASPFCNIMADFCTNRTRLLKVPLSETHCEMSGKYTERNLLLCIGIHFVLSTVPQQLVWDECKTINMIY